MGELGVEAPDQMGFQRAPRDLEDVGHEEVRGRRHAAGDPGDERAVPFVRFDLVPAAEVFQLVQGSPHPFQPRVDGAIVGNHPVRMRRRTVVLDLLAGVREQPRVGNEDGDSRAAVLVSDRREGFDAVVDLLGLGGRTRADVAIGDGDHVIGRGVTGADRPVDAVERLEHRDPVAVFPPRKEQDDDPVDQRLDGSRASGRVPDVQQPQLGLVQDLQHLLEIVLLDENLSAGVHEAHPIRGGLHADIDPAFLVSAVRFAEFAGYSFSPEFVVYVPSLVTDLLIANLIPVRLTHEVPPNSSDAESRIPVRSSRHAA